MLYANGINTARFLSMKFGTNGKMATIRTVGCPTLTLQTTKMPKQQKSNPTTTTTKQQTTYFISRTPLNQKFSKTVVAKDLSVKSGYKPGSDISRQQLSYANIYWAKQIAGAVGGGLLGGKKVSVLSADPIDYSNIKNKGGIAKLGPIRTANRSNARNTANTEGGKADACIVVNPGGEETWDRLKSSLCKSNKSPFVVLNNAYSTSYGLGNKKKYEEAYYLKRVTKGWIYRAYPGPWKAYLEKPDGSTELLESYKEKPELRVVAEIVREESFKRYAINNDRWMSGRM